MNPIVLALPIALIGVEWGCQPLPGGGMEYIIQIEPELVADLYSGRIRLVQSDVHPALRDIRSYRIVVGNDELPRQLPDQPSEVQTVPAAAGDRYAPSGSPVPRGGVVASFGGVEGPRTAASQPPALLPAEGALHRLAERPVAHVEPVGGASAAAPAAGAPIGGSSPADRPWAALLATLIALFASLGGNVYLAWIAWESRRRCRRLLAEHGEPDDAGAEPAETQAEDREEDAA